MIKVIKKLVFVIGFLFALNIILQPFKINVPINIFSIAMFYFLGIPSVFYFILLKFF